MAFQQPTRQAIRRPSHEEDERVDSRAHTTIAGPQESQTWVLFSPDVDTTTDASSSSALSSLLSETQPTPGRSRLGQPGSQRSFQHAGYAPSFGPSTVSGRHVRPLPLLLTASLGLESEEEDAEDAELDSLDSHLADFRAAAAQPQMSTGAVENQSSMQTTTTITTVNLPAHDGLGTFRLGETAGMSAALQERLYAFEQFNPRRVSKRRRESIELAAEVEQELSEELQRMQRIEAWRWEHSRVLLEEIRKQTRRRRGSNLSSRRGSRLDEATTAATAPASVASHQSVSDLVTAGVANVDWHEQEDDDLLFGPMAGDDREEGEGLWSRITRKFMVEVIGLDDEVLSILLGEALAQTSEEDEEGEGMDVCTTPRASDTLLAAYDGLAREVPEIRTGSAAEAVDTSPSWRLQIIERIAKELGQFVHRHMAAHPGAYSTYQRVQQMPLPYAGLPVIPEAMMPVAEDVVTERSRGVTETATIATTPSPQFQPTILQAQPMEIPGQSRSATLDLAATPTATMPTPLSTFTQEEWEQDLDIKLVFRYLRSRFVSDAPSASSSLHLGSGSAGKATATTAQDAAAKAARVRQHHPLVGRTANRQTGGERRAMPAYRTIPVPTSPVGLRHQTGSCASQSTRRSARRSSASSSRHYWDIGGSIGTGSMVASAGPMGSWAEA